MTGVVDGKLIEETLYFLTQRVWPFENSDFFPALAEFLGRNLGVDFAFIGTLQKEGARAATVGMYAAGGAVTNIDYDLEGTPCEQVLQTEFRLYNGDVQSSFPQDQRLSEWGVCAYLGVPLRDACGEPIGLVGVMAKRPFQNPDQLVAVIRLVVIRTAHELMLQNHLRETKRHRERLTKLLAKRTAQFEEAKQQAAAAERTKTVFLAQVSHELRTPLTAILGYSYLLQRSQDLPEKLRGKVDTIARSTQHLDKLISDGLTAARGRG